MTQIRRWLVAAVTLGACAVPDAAPPTAPIGSLQPPPPPPLMFDAPLASPLVPPDAAAPDDAAPVAPEVWLKGSTHVHARPSGDSSEPIDKVIEWYQGHGYDFIALTDHNRVSEVDGDTRGRVAVSTKHLIVLAGIELTHNPSGCLPPGDKSRKCRIHVNVLGVTARPGGKLEWAERKSHLRVDMYRAALLAAKALGGTVVQVNHPQWFWGMTPDVLVDVVQHGAQLVEIANVQFAKWNAGDVDHPSTEALWDAALMRGATVWGVASDDAHDYEHRGKYPAGGGWVVVKARREPAAILEALAAGRFYASTGVVVTRAELDGGELVVEAEPGGYAIAWIENGKLVATVAGATARRALPQTGYLRAVITRDDGKQAWIQPVRR